MAQSKQSLACIECLVQEILRQAIIDDVYEANTTTGIREFFRHGKLLAFVGALVPSREIDDWNR